MRSTAILIPPVALAVAVSPATAAAGNVTFGGATDQGRNVKLVADARGRVIRGAATVLTECSGRFEPFRARLELHRPLDRSTQDGFRDSGSRVDSDEEFSARYKHEIEGEYANERNIEGTLSLEVVFRKDGKKYVTCRTSDVDFTATELKQGRAVLSPFP